MGTTRRKSIPPRSNVFGQLDSPGTGQGGRKTRFKTKSRDRGVGGLSRPLRIDVGVDRIKDFLMSRIDAKNPVEVEKVGRYLKHIEIFRRMEKTVKKEGVSVITENGSQTFVKAHPLLNEMNKINSSLLSIEKSFNFIDDDDDHSEDDLL